MTPKETYKTILEADLNRLQTDLESIANFEEKSGDWIALPGIEEPTQADDNLEADGIEEWNERRATVSQLETSFKNVTRALEKITAGSYGYCELCQSPIEADRLDAQPSARTCKTHRDNEKELSL
jgi:RNA polymerase-binding transcription factor DksA